MEQWAQLPGHPGYIISDSGRVKNIETGKELTIKNRGKSVCITSSKLGKVSTVSVPRSMYIAFVNAEIPSGMVVCCDGIIMISNLRLMTVAERNRATASKSIVVPIGHDDTPCPLMGRLLRIRWAA